MARRIFILFTALTLFVTALSGCANNSVHTEQDVPDAAITTVGESDESPATTEATTTEAETTTVEATTEATTTTEETTTVATTTEATTTTETQPQWVITPASEKLYATVDLNVRAAPDPNGERISHVDEGDLVEVTGWVDNGWARIKFRKSEYFVNGKYLSKEKPVAVTTTVATTTEKKTEKTTQTTKKESTTKPKNTYVYNPATSKYDLSNALNTDSLKELCKDYFRIGFGLTGNAPANGAVNSKEYMQVVEYHANSVTLTNLMKPSYLLDKNGSQRNANSGKETVPALNFSAIDKTLKWCYDNGVQMRGHTLIWHAQTPDWFFKEGFKDNGKLVDYDTMAARLDSYIKQVLEYVQKKYPGVIYAWDVVNEAVDPDFYDPKSYFSVRTKHGSNLDNLWYSTLGEDYVELAFVSARKYADKDVKLFYNDFNTFMSNKRYNIYKLCEKLYKKGLLDGLGMQAYWGMGWPNISDLESAIKYFAKIGMEIQITELSCGVDSLTKDNLEAQAKRYAEYFKMFQRLDTAGGGPANITSVTLFGLQDGFVMYGTDNETSRLFDTNFQPKPCFYSIQKVMKELY